jgi:two-component system OmpR family response regulator
MTRQQLLLVDDERAVRSIASISLERVGGWAVTSASSGRGALQAVQEYGPFKVILMDVMMPELDGPTTLQRMRDGGVLSAQVPVIFLTEELGAAERKRLLSHGARGVIAKPLDPMTLPEELQQILDHLEHDEAPVDPESAESLIDEGDPLLRADPFEDAPGRVEESIAVWGEMIDRYSEARSPVRRERVASALWERAELLVATGRCAEAIVLADALIERVGDEHDPQLMYLLAGGLAVKGAALLGERRLEEAIVPLDELIARFEDDDPTLRSTAAERRLRTQVAFALRDKAVALYRLGRDEEAKAAEDEMVTRFGEDALAGFDELSSRYAQANDPHMRELLVSALQGKAVVLSGLDRPNEALQVLTELIDRFQHDKNPEIQNIVAEACAEIADGESH